MVIGVVGPCGAGKSSLVAALKSNGYSPRHIAQEHSYVPDMWRRLTNPDILVYLDVSFENSTLRRKLDWTYPEYLEQVRRLAHARQHADLYIDTNSQSLEQVFQIVLSFISKSTNSTIHK